MSFNSEYEKKQYIDRMNGFLRAKIEIMKTVEKHLDKNEEDIDKMLSIIEFYEDCDKSLTEAKEKILDGIISKKEETNSTIYANKVYNINPPVRKSIVK